MRTVRRRIWLGAILLPLVISVTSLPTSAATMTQRPHTGPPVTAWDLARPVPGLSKLDVGHYAAATAVSCGAPGDCGLGGYFRDKVGHLQAFLAIEIAGRWQPAIEPASIAALDTAGEAAISTISCRGEGSCVAAGTYVDAADHTQGFGLTETDHVWSVAKEIPGLAALNAGDDADVVGSSCGGPGNCEVAGTYDDGSHTQPFVVNEKNGVWGSAIEVPGVASLNVGNATIAGISCASIGYCTVAGGYEDSHGDQEVFVDDEFSTWDDAIELPGLAALATGGSTMPQAVTCSSSGDCVVVGGYETNAAEEAFIARENGAVWGSAIEAPGVASLNAGGEGVLNSVSCVTNGNCTAVGSYLDNDGIFQPMALTETGAVWGNAVEINAGALGTYREAVLQSVSCSSSGNCNAIGHTLDTTSSAFDDVEVGGTWERSTPIPGMATLVPSGGQGIALQLSCPTSSSCAAAGLIASSSGTNYQGFVVDRTTGTVPTSPRSVRAAALSGIALVQWSPPASDGGFQITGYVVTASPGGRTCATTGSTECIVTGLANAKRYSFTVVATNPAGGSPRSSPSNPVVPR